MSYFYFYYIRKNLKTFENDIQLFCDEINNTLNLKLSKTIVSLEYVQELFDKKNKEFEVKWKLENILKYNKELIKEGKMVIMLRNDLMEFLYGE